MPGTRKPVRLLEHVKVSGLFVRDGEYIADIKPDTGGRIIRKLGPDRARAFKLFDALLEELGDITGENPRLADFLVNTFLPTQRRLRAYDYSRKSVEGVVRWRPRTLTCGSETFERTTWSVSARSTPSAIMRLGP